MLAWLWHCTVREAQARIDAQEYIDWIAWHSLVGGWGPEADWLRTGTICATIANIVRPKNTEAYRPEDFTPLYRRDLPEMDDDEIFATLMLSAVPAT